VSAAGLVPLACDAHFHVFGPLERYPPEHDELYAPPHAPLDDYLDLARRLGLARYVLVQPSIYGTDNRCLLDAMRELGPARCRGVVAVDDGRAPDLELAAWHSLGVRGLRIQTHAARPDAGLARSFAARIERLAALAQVLGWHLDFLTPAWLTAELLPTFWSLEVDYTVAHLGLFGGNIRDDRVVAEELPALLRHGSGRCWVKLTGFYRSSTVSDYADLTGFVRELVAAGPQRLVWGSDYPHVFFQHRVDAARLFDLLAEWVPDAVERYRILVENPASLYGFGLS